MNVAQRYAKSLLDLATELDISERVYNDLILIDKILSENNDLRIVLQSPIIRQEKKEKLFFRRIRILRTHPVFIALRLQQPI